MLDSELKEKLIEETRFWYNHANEKLGRSFCYPEILFDLRGTVAGQAFTRSNKIRYNLGIAKDNFSKFIDSTVPHEVAHVIADLYFQKRCVHGKEWKWMMSEVFGKEPSRCHSYDVSSHRARNTKRYVYRCRCDSGCTCGAKHHKMIQKQTAIISCRVCSFKLIPESLIKILDTKAVL